jgi:hypothetical protein
MEETVAAYLGSQQAVPAAASDDNQPSGKPKRLFFAAWSNLTDLSKPCQKQFIKNEEDLTRIAEKARLGSRGILALERLERYI